MILKSKIEPCPFCKGKGSVHENLNTFPKSFYVSCDNRDCHVMVRTLNRATKKEAIELWNKRG